MSYRLINANALAAKYPEVNDMPCIYVDLPKLDNLYHRIEAIGSCEAPGPDNDFLEAAQRRNELFAKLKETVEEPIVTKDRHSCLSCQWFNPLKVNPCDRGCTNGDKWEPWTMAKAEEEAEET